MYCEEGLGELGLFSLAKGQPGDLSAAHDHLKGGCTGDGDGLGVHSDRIRGSGRVAMRETQGPYRNFVCLFVCLPSVWSNPSTGFPREAVEPPFLQVLRAQMDMALSNLIYL